MYLRFISFLFFVMALSACSTAPKKFSTPQASGYYIDEPMQCVPFARDVSGFSVYGDAYTWWFQVPEHRRGATPRDGAVLVLAKTNKLSRGHLAVVKDVKSARRILVSHTNWGYDHDTRRVVYDTMLVEDISPANNWTRLRFWNKDAKAFGSPYEAYGFIYE